MNELINSVNDILNMSDDFLMELPVMLVRR